MLLVRLGFQTRRRFVICKPVCAGSVVSMKEPRKLSQGEKALVWVSAASVGICWLFMLLLLVIVVAETVGLASGITPPTIRFSRSAGFLILAAFGMFIVLGLVYLVTASSVRCPKCGLRFLRNPKGLGPAGFSYNDRCPRLPGVNPWAYQMGRLLCTGSIKCIGCGEEVCGASNQGAVAAPNGGPATRCGSAGTREGPPSVS